MKRLLLVLLLATMPAAAGTRTILITGDSLAWGKTNCAAPNDWGSLLGAVQGATVVNIAKNGTQVQAAGPRVEIATPFPYWVCIIEGGTNDITAGALQADIISAWEDGAELCHDAGFYTIGIGIFPRGNSSGYTEGMETKRLAVNAALASYAVSHTWLHYLSPDDAGYGTGSSPVDLKAEWDVGDGLHLNCLGQTQLAADVGALMP